MSAARISVFAVEDTTAQVCWSALPPGPATVAAGEARVELEVPDTYGPGSVVLEGLAPGTEHRLEVTAGGRRRRVAVAGRFRTLSPPPGEALARIATISDMHIGERGFGVLPRVREPATVAPEDSFTVRSTTAALAEAVAWGARLVVVKGDITYSGRPAQWDLAAKALTGAAVPVHATLGNHDVTTFATDGRRALAAHGITVPREPEAIDLPGLRVVIGHTAHRGRRGGSVDDGQRAALARLAAEAPGPVLAALHHFPDPLPFPSRFPRGIPQAEGDALLRALAEANPATFVTFGHSHRNRRHTRHGLPVTEVAATKDFPGVWAGYAIHEGGIRQVVRRIAEPATMAWTEECRRPVGGVWGLFAPGRRSWRCFSHPWPARP